MAFVVIFMLLNTEAGAEGLSSSVDDVPEAKHLESILRQPQ